MGLFLKVIEDQFKAINPSELVKISNWALNDEELPQYIRDKPDIKLHYMTLVFISEELSIESHAALEKRLLKYDQSVATMVEAYSMEDIIYLFTKEQTAIYNVWALTMGSITQFVLKNPLEIFKTFGKFFGASEKADKSNPLLQFSPEGLHDAVCVYCKIYESSSGRQVEHISILDLNGAPILNTYVLCNMGDESHIYDSSGIANGSLISTILQDELVGLLDEIIGESTIIIGHCVGDWLEVLGVYHTRVIDIARIFINTDGSLASLGVLAQRLLGEEFDQEVYGCAENAKICLRILSYAVDEITASEHSKPRYNKMCRIFIPSEDTLAGKSLVKGGLNIVTCEYKNYLNSVPKCDELAIVFFKCDDRLYVSI